MTGKRSVSLVAPTGESQSHCGYCKQDGTSRSYGIWAYHMTCNDYQQLINQGWRRSGRYLYKPDLPETCCPQYTIRLNSQAYKPSKSHKKVLKKLSRYLKRDWEPPSRRGVDATTSDAGQHDEDEDMESDAPIKETVLSEEARDRLGSRHKVEAMVVDHEQDTGDSEHDSAGESLRAGEGEGQETRPTSKTDHKHDQSSHEGTGGPSKKSKGPVLAQSDDWSQVVEEALRPQVEGGRQLRVVLERSSFQEESFNLYCRYQLVIHNDDEEDLTPKRYKGFLVDSPLIDWRFDGLKPEQVPSQKEFPGYGSFHQKYYLDDQLVAVGVIDLLPQCVSSVYFFYEPELSFLSLGVFSALHEIAFARSLSKLQPALKYYYLGFYIHSCAKMRYKGQYKPSELLDPVAFQWVPLDLCLPLLDKQKYTTFLPGSDAQQPASGSDKGSDKVTDTDLGSMMAFTRGEVVHIKNIRLPADEKADLKEFYRKVGATMARKMVVVLN